MEFPQLAPSNRSFSYGDYPVKKYNAMDGFETRILFGSQRFNFTLNLSYDNITDDEAVKFLQHFDEQTGTFQAYFIGPDNVGSSLAGPKKGVSKDLAEKMPGPGRWRYSEPPSITSVYPGVSSVRVVLVSVLV